MPKKLEWGKPCDSFRVFEAFHQLELAGLTQKAGNSFL